MPFFLPANLIYFLLPIVFAQVLVRRIDILHNDSSTSSKKITEAEFICRRNLYSELDIKSMVVVRKNDDGSGINKEELVLNQCDKHTSRCYPTIVNDTPDYLHRGRWTPPW
jgi:hypothetical protein